MELATTTENMTALPYYWDSMTDMELELLQEKLGLLGYYPGCDTDREEIEREKRQRLPHGVGVRTPFRSDGF